MTKRILSAAEIIREKGTDRRRFVRGQVDKYTWVDIGSSYLPSDILAAFLLAQLERHEQIQGMRKRIWDRYDERLTDWAARYGVTRPHVPSHCEHPHHMYCILLPSLACRQAMIEHLKRRSILSVFHYLPLNPSEMGARFGGRSGQCPVTEKH